MTNLETSSSKEDLTGEQLSQESPTESIEPKGTDLPEDAKNFQHAIQKAREREKEAIARAAELEQRLSSYKEDEKRRKLESMTEADRFKAIAEEESQKRGKLELKFAVQEALAGKELPAGIRDLIVRTPWAIPAVQDELGDTFTWDEAIDSVKRHLPAYIDSLVVNKGTPELEDEPSTKKVDSERAVDSGVVKEHIYTKSEIERLSKDPVEYEKHRDKILKQLSKYGGVLPM